MQPVEKGAYSTNRVRITTTDGAVINGRLLAGTLSTLEVEDDAGTRHDIPRAKVAKREFV